MPRLRDTLCVVTGASSGIGLALAETLARADAAVIGAARRFETRVLPRVPEPGEVLRVHLDVTDEAAVDRLFGDVQARLGPDRGIDVLINSAGSGQFAPLDQIEVSELRHLLDVHVVGTFLCARAAARSMTSRGRGHIINVGSLAAIQPFSDCAAYAAAKAGQLGLGRVLAEELRARGVRVTSLIAGAVDTPIWNERPNFDREAMLRPERLAGLIVDLIARPDLAVSELIVTPPAGAL